jgi:AcrR family transcriptional regulator
MRLSGYDDIHSNHGRGKNASGNRGAAVTISAPVTRPPSSPQPSPPRSYGGVPAHERVAARRDRLVTAARELFGRQGIGATTVKGACEASGLSQRYFYESFASVEALAVAVADEIIEEIIGAAFVAVGDEADPRARVHIVFKTLVDAIAAEPGAGRIIFIETAGNGPDLAAWRRQMLLRAAQLNEMWFSVPEGTADHALEDRIASLMVTGGVIEAIVAWLDGVVEATPEQLARALANAVGDSAFAGAE